MNKSRLEAFSDGVFAIIITILVLEIKVPELGAAATNHDLWEVLREYQHILIGYFLSVAVVGMFWMTHYFMFHIHAKTIDRWVIQINILFLAVLALIPFSAGLIGSYPDLEVATVLYGVNLLAASLINLILYVYIQKSANVENGEISSRMRKQGHIRQAITIIGFGIGILFALYGHYYTSIAMYLIPVVFNNIPGLLDRAEKILGIRIE